ncbi:MAG: 2-amino-4-hydroxy-6-hydroxymethyldihydropteridine diphosphokinase, partial [bacterium]
LDLLAYGSEVIHEDGLQVPHPRMHERRFVLEPFCDLEPEFIHPMFKKTMREFLTALSAKGKAQSAKLSL